MSSDSDSPLSQFLQNFPSNSFLHHSKSYPPLKPWVFWSETEGCGSNSSSSSSSSVDLATPVIHDMIKSALSYISYFLGLAQFWAPVTIDGRLVLSTSGQPFAVHRLSNKFAKYRLDSEKHKYNIDANKLDIQPDHMIISGGPATAFMNCRTSMSKLEGFQLEYDDTFDISVMLPIRFHSQSNCIGVLEFTLDTEARYLVYFLFDIVEIIKKFGLDVFYVQDLIPYKTINGLQVTKDEIEKALKFVCVAHHLALAQVWITYEDKNNLRIPEDTQTKPLLAIKLTGYLYEEAYVDDEYQTKEYSRFCDVAPRAIEEDLLLVTLQRYESRYMSEPRGGIYKCFNSETCALAICLRSSDTGDFSYVFEFIWTERSNDAIIPLKAIHITLERHLPRFKFASRAELVQSDPSIWVNSATSTIDNEAGKSSETEKIKVCQGKRLSPMVVDHIAPSQTTCKTTSKVLPREVIAKQFGKTMKEAAANLNVSLSTLKRKCKEYDISEWPGRNFMKRSANDSSIIQINTNEEDNGAIQDPSTVNLKQETMTIKAEYAQRMIKFHLRISKANFVNVEEEISRRFKLNVGTYKLEYFDEDEDWISLTSDEEMSDFIKSSRKLDQIVVRLRVLPSPQPI